jgi:hypothetical protein
MWSRSFLKIRAKAVLKISYWKAFLVSLVIAIVGGGNGGFNFNWNFGNNRPHNPFLNTGGVMFPKLFAIIIVVGSIIILLAIAFRILIGYPLEVGGRKYFTQSAQYEIDMNYLGFGFKKSRYSDIVIAMLWRGFLNFLWFLLLIIPGIVKTYAYRMVPYILGDNPNIGYKRAVDLSKKMTNGQKFDMFVLDLSFIGWYLLGFIALLVGMLFVMPYENATKGELYILLRQAALDSGLCSYEELKLNPPLNAPDNQGI